MKICYTHIQLSTHACLSARAKGLTSVLILHEFLPVHEMMMLSWVDLMVHTQIAVLPHQYAKGTAILLTCNEHMQ